jgi:hypothetical protein
MKLKFGAKKAGWRENPGNIEANWLISAECTSPAMHERTRSIAGF